MLTFHAATARKDSKGYPAKGFQTENYQEKETIKGMMTIWAAFNFEEKKKKSIVSKWADW
jgi:hypothetical protein